MYNLLANETAESLRAFFQNTLPSLAEDWWARHVVSALTFQQQRRVEESRIESLAGLDLAARRHHCRWLPRHLTTEYLVVKQMRMRWN